MGPPTRASSMAVLFTLPISVMAPGCPTSETTFQGSYVCPRKASLSTRVPVGSTQDPSEAGPPQASKGKGGWAGNWAVRVRAGGCLPLRRCPWFQGVPGAQVGLGGQEC